jgi:hypothetical protein
MDTTAEELGIGGGRNVINTLIKLKQAMEYNDTFAILGSLANLDSGLESINESRAIYGATTRRMNSTKETHQQSIVNQVCPFDIRYLVLLVNNTLLMCLFSRVHPSSNRPINCPGLINTF